MASRDAKKGASACRNGATEHASSWRRGRRTNGLIEAGQGRLSPGSKRVKGGEIQSGSTILSILVRRRSLSLLPKGACLPSLGQTPGLSRQSRGCTCRKPSSNCFPRHVIVGRWFVRSACTATHRHIRGVKISPSSALADFTNITHNIHPDQISKMSADEEENLAIYDEIEIEDMNFDETLQLYHYPCPCGDRFQIALDDLRDEQDIAVCPSCSLMIRVIFDLVGFPPKWLSQPATDSFARTICPAPRHRPKTRAAASSSLRSQASINRYDARPDKTEPSMDAYMACLAPAFAPDPEPFRDESISAMATRGLERVARRRLQCDLLPNLDTCSVMAPTVKRGNAQMASNRSASMSSTS